jgi:hypothetical protein
MPVPDPSKAVWDASGVAQALEKYGFEHLRVRAHGKTLTIESGPEDDPVKHARLRRDTVDLWILYVADHRGRFSPTGLRATWPTLVDALVRDFGWLLEPIA